jgi:hypothetical protein
MSVKTKIQQPTAAMPDFYDWLEEGRNQRFSDAVSSVRLMVNLICSAEDGIVTGNALHALLQPHVKALIEMDEAIDDFTKQRRMGMGGAA